MALTNMDSLKYLIDKFEIELTADMPIAIHNINRTIMAQTLGELGYKNGAEIGVAQGKYAQVLFESNPNLKLYCIDIWHKYANYPEYRNRIHRYFKEAQQRLATHDAVFIKKFSMEAVADFPDASLDFVFLDGAHDFKNIADDICEWTKKVRIGGMVFGHDYENSTETHDKYPRDVKDVVNAYTHSHSIIPWFSLANNLQDNNFKGDRPGWMFIRQDTDRL